MSKKTNKKELGKGIRALLSSIDEVQDISKEEVKTYRKFSLMEIPIDSIEANPFQPRNDFDQESLEELARSIETFGLIQPVTVRTLGREDRFQLISGERRTKAARMAGLTEIPAYIRVADDQGMLEMALVENVQRDDLNAIEVAISMKRLIDECQMTHEQLSDRIGKNRSTVTNYTRLLKLPPEIQQAIKSRKISMGHARSLAGINDIIAQLEVFRRILDRDLSVRATEKLIRSLTDQPKSSVRKVDTRDLSPDYLKVRDRMSSIFGRKVGLTVSGSGKGKITISFDSVDDLNEILETLD